MGEPGGHRAKWNKPAQKDKLIVTGSKTVVTRGWELGKKGRC